MTRMGKWGNCMAMMFMLVLVLVLVLCGRVLSFITPFLSV